MMLKGLTLLLCVLHLIAPGHSSDVPVVAVREGSDAVLRCSSNPVKNLDKELFDWKLGETTDQRKDVFMYDRGSYEGNGHSKQHEQFRGRVSHFPDQLIDGNASIIIRNTKIEDTGLYTCIFPFPRYQSVSMRLVVGVANEPYVSICNVSESGVRLKCEAKGAFPQPEVQWVDCDGNPLPAEDPEVSERGRLFDVTLQTTVKSTNTNCFHCVVKQENFHHQIQRSLTVPEKLFEKMSREVDPGSCSGQMVLGAFIGAFIGALLLAVGQALLVATNCITVSLNKGRHQPPQSSSEEPLKVETEA